jgi:hypothetical protein
MEKKGNNGSYQKDVYKGTCELMKEYLEFVYLLFFGKLVWAVLYKTGLDFLIAQPFFRSPELMEYIF